ncbi:hypothetical protein QBC34DRAFT_130278 [Podospora aff. communis PSN243]|uniref:Uncharacterized protein n=1 Tax=Podospora aff. communis PSN243 TaxID=3040156 RepID=A0AAV9GHW5_9PEZI|nr:hypothetical protein QBC34DRAFT_130278 [Podospora aff. communis PSN243]
MAHNSSSGNPIGAEDGPNFHATPPPVPDDIKSQVDPKATSSTDLKAAEHVSGQDDSQKDLTRPAANQKEEMEGLGRSEVAKRG